MRETTHNARYIQRARKGMLLILDDFIKDGVYTLDEAKEMVTKEYFDMCDRVADAHDSDKWTKAGRATLEETRIMLWRWLYDKGIY